MIVEAGILVAAVSVGGVAVERIVSLSAQLLAQCARAQYREAASQPDEGDFHREVLQRLRAIHSTESQDDRRRATACLRNDLRDLPPDAFSSRPSPLPSFLLRQLQDAVEAANDSAPPFETNSQGGGPCAAPSRRRSTAARSCAGAGASGGSSYHSAPSTLPKRRSLLGGQHSAFPELIHSVEASIASRRVEQPCQEALEHHEEALERLLQTVSASNSTAPAPLRQRAVSHQKLTGSPFADDGWADAASGAGGCAPISIAQRAGRAPQAGSSGPRSKRDSRGGDTPQAQASGAVSDPERESGEQDTLAHVLVSSLSAGPSFALRAAHGAHSHDSGTDFYCLAAMSGSQEALRPTHRLARKSQSQSVLCAAGEAAAAQAARTYNASARRAGSPAAAGRPFRALPRPRSVVALGGLCKSGSAGSMSQMRHRQSRLPDACVHGSAAPSSVLSSRSGGVLSRSRTCDRDGITIHRVMMDAHGGAPRVEDTVVQRPVKLVKSMTHLGRAAAPGCERSCAMWTQAHAQHAPAALPRFGKDVIGAKTSSASSCSWSPRAGSDPSAAPSRHSPSTREASLHTAPVSLVRDGPSATHAPLPAAAYWKDVPIMLCHEAITSGFHPPIRVGPPCPGAPAAPYPVAPAISRVPSMRSCLSRDSDSLRRDEAPHACARGSEALPRPALETLHSGLERTHGGAKAFLSTQQQLHSRPSLDTAITQARSMLTVQLAGCSDLSRSVGMHRDL